MTAEDDQHRLPPFVDLGWVYVGSVWAAGPANSGHEFRMAEDIVTPGTAKAAQTAKAGADEVQAGYLQNMLETLTTVGFCLFLLIVVAILGLLLFTIVMNWYSPRSPAAPEDESSGAAEWD